MIKLRLKIQKSIINIKIMLNKRSELILLIVRLKNIKRKSNIDFLYNHKSENNLNLKLLKKEKFYQKKQLIF